MLNPATQSRLFGLPSGVLKTAFLSLEIITRSAKKYRFFRSPSGPDLAARCEDALGMTSHASRLFFATHEQPQTLTPGRFASLRGEHAPLAAPPRYAGAKRTHRHNSRLATLRRSSCRLQTSSRSARMSLPFGLCALPPPIGSPRCRSSGRRAD